MSPQMQTIMQKDAVEMSLRRLRCQIMMTDFEELSDVEQATLVAQQSQLQAHLAVLDRKYLLSTRKKP